MVTHRNKHRVEPAPFQMSVEEFARACHFHPSSIRRLVALGHLRTRGKDERISISSDQLHVPSGDAAWSALHG